MELLDFHQALVESILIAERYQMEDMKCKCQQRFVVASASSTGHALLSIGNNNIAACVSAIDLRLENLVSVLELTQRTELPILDEVTSCTDVHGPSYMFQLLADARMP